ncbi:hypothetical protein ACFX19_025575 [Malus domestica]
MGSKTQPKLPVIDLSDGNLKLGTDAWLLACKQIKDALEEYGCFEAIYHKVPLRWKIYLALPQLFWTIFIPSSGVDNPTTVEGAQGFTRIMWPQGNDHFCYILMNQYSL